MAEQTVFSSKYFHLREVVPGVYAAIVVRGGGALGNAAIVDLGDRTLVFDTFYIPQAAEDLRRAAEQLTGRHVSVVINSHGHNDHVLGNQVFREADIIATEATREFARARTEMILKFIKENPDHPEKFALVVEQETDPKTREYLANGLGDTRELFAAFPTIEPRLPNVLFEKEMHLHGTKRSATLLTYGGGHTVSDAFLYLPEEKVAIMGDLLSVRNHNQFMAGDAYEFVRNLQQVERLPIDIAIPGHGHVGTKSDITAMRVYLEELIQLADEFSARGVSPEQAASEVTIPEKYADWYAPVHYANNVRTLLERKAAQTTQASL